MPRVVRTDAVSPARTRMAETRRKALLSPAASLRSSTRSRRFTLSSSTSSTSSSRAALADGVLLAGMRQLRSRQVPIPATNGPGVDRSVATTAALVRGRRRRSRSATSSRASESMTCDAVSAAAARTEAKRRNPPVVQTRYQTRARTTASVTAASTSSSIQLTGSVVQGQDQLPTLRTSRADRNVQSQSAQAKAQRKTQTVKQETLPAEQATVSCVKCQGMMLLCDLESHQSRCLSFPCPLALDNCQWGGTISQAVDHILKNHRSVSCITGPTAVITMKNWRKSGPIQWVTLQTCLGQNFLIVIQKSDKVKCPFFFGTVRLFGYQEDADRFEYRMMLKTRGKISRTFSYSTIVRALHDGNTAINKGDCFVFDTSHAEIFSFEGTLEVEVSISVMKM